MPHLQPAPMLGPALAGLTEGLAERAECARILAPLYLALLALIQGIIGRFDRLVADYNAGLLPPFPATSPIAARPRAPRANIRPQATAIWSGWPFAAEPAHQAMVETQSGAAGDIRPASAARTLSHPPARAMRREKPPVTLPISASLWRLACPPRPVLATAHARHSAHPRLRTPALRAQPPPSRKNASPVLP